MRIAFFSDTYLPNRDGVVTSIVQLRQELEARGHEVFVFCPGSKKQKLENKDDNVFHFTSATFKPYPDYRLALFPFPTAVRRMKELKIDVIHSHGIATTGIAAIESSNKAKIPALATFHTLVPEATHYLTKNESVQKMLEGVAWKYLNWYYRQFKRVVVPSEHIMARLQEHGISNTQVIPSGIDVARFSGDSTGEARKKYGIKKGAPLILHVGRIVEEKRIDDLLEAVPSVLNMKPDAKFLICGRGPYEAMLRQKAKEKKLDDSVIFTGFVEDSELPGIYADADVFAFPSLFETQGLVVLEAMAAGAIPVVRKGTAPAEFIDEGKNGFHFSDKFDFAEKIVKAVDGKQRMDGDVRGTAKKYDIKKTSKDITALYELLVANNRK